MGQNPYQAPTAHVDDTGARGPELARRGTRLAAAILDGLAYLVVWIGAFFAGGGDLESVSGLTSTALLICIVGSLAVLDVNLYFLHRNGQTIGKRLLNVKIVRDDGSHTALGRAFGLRMVVPSIIYTVPLLGFVFYLVVVLFIFRGDRRCVHDLMADTRVVPA